MQISFGAGRIPPKKKGSLQAARKSFGGSRESVAVEIVPLGILKPRLGMAQEPDHILDRCPVLVLFVGNAMEHLFLMIGINFVRLAAIEVLRFFLDLLGFPPDFDHLAGELETPAL